MPDIKIKRYADKENLKKLVKYSKDTFANKSEINENYYTKEQIDIMLKSVSGGTGGGGTGDIGDIGDNYYTKSEIDTKLTSKANTSDLSTVATSGSYNDLLDKPTSFDVDLSNYYTKSEVDNLLRNTGSGAGGGNVLDMWPDGAAAHNAMWGGRNITDAFNSGIVSANIKNGTFKNIFPGDYIRKQITIPRVLADNGTILLGGDTYNVTWVITDCNYWSNTANHVAIVPGIGILSARMNPTNTTEGGYAGSEMFKKIIPACATGIVNAFGNDHILTFRDAITNSVDTSHVSSGIPQLTGTPGLWDEWVSVQCNLMSEKMVYGAPICSGGAMDNIMATRQMSAFRLSTDLINNATFGRTWWLRDVVSSSSFAAVYSYPLENSYATAWGAADEDRQTLSPLKVRPFALLR